MNFKSNKSKLDFKVHYNFVYMSIFVCVYIYTPFFVVFFFFTIGSGCSSKKVDYFSYNFNSSSALRLLHISTMLKNNRETHRYHKHPTIRILKNGGVLACQYFGQDCPLQPQPPLSGCCHDQREAFGTMENVHDFKLLQYVDTN